MNHNSIPGLDPVSFGFYSKRLQSTIECRLYMKVWVGVRLYVYIKKEFESLVKKNNDLVECNFTYY